MLNAELAGIDNGVVPWQKTWMAHEPADTICDAIALLDVGLRVKFANEPFYRTLSLSPENTLGKPFYELGTCQEGSSPVRSLLERILRSTNGFQGVDVTYTFSPKDERVMRVRACRMQTHASEEPVILVTIGNRATENRLDERLHASEERYRTLVDTTQDGIWTIDAAGNTTFANASMAAMLGTSVDNMLGKPSFVYVFEEDVEKAAELFRRKLAGDTGLFEFRIRRVDGSWFWASVAGTPLKNATGETVGLLGAFRDITEGKLAEEAIARHANELARSNADLQHFAHVTSHDLMEPLRPMRAFSQLLMRRYAEQLDRDAHDYLGFIASAAERMTHLVNDLLSYSKTSDHAGSAMRRVELHKPLEWARKNLETRINESGAHIGYGELPVVHADELQLVQLFQNLLSNAIKYQRADEPPRMEVLAQLQEAEWVIAVRDNGIGIAPEKREEVFGLFKRLHGREIPGTGIGLAICRKIAENHNGRIWVESEPGRGSTFLFTLPVRNDEPPPTQSQSAA